ncbi:hypothetical protein [Pleionea sp. CnH1-48]|uniref:hypothetical protein n=1 Tax=Pleionea sp. CnH1-48 TaxID=2954494 RepID=UPI0020984B47|nr:hypothetical protein [Pleionea sp. CnH1-48]MCO7226350.1 hypothetical protein [Pleionea sp. CnH1-48]
MKHKNVILAVFVMSVSAVAYLLLPEDPEVHYPEQKTSEEEKTMAYTSHSDA